MLHPAFLISRSNTPSVDATGAVCILLAVDDLCVPDRMYFRLIACSVAVPLSETLHICAAGFMAPMDTYNVVL